MFETLTALLPQLKKSESNGWKDDEKKTTVMVMPIAEAVTPVRRLNKEIHYFVENHPEMKLVNYRGILVEKVGAEDAASADVDAGQLDGRTIIALLLSASSAGQSEEGSLLSLCKKGKVIPWLERLKKLDDSDDGSGFRSMRRFKQKVSEDKCIEVLITQPRGVLSMFGDDGYPYGVPIDFYYDADNGKIYFHCAKVGHKIDALRRNNKVCFTVMDEGYYKEGDWALSINSVIIFGTIRFIEDRDEVLRTVSALGYKYYPSKEAADKEVRDAIDRVQMLELTIDHMTGKLVNEK